MSELSKPDDEKCVPFSVSIPRWMKEAMEERVVKHRSQKLPSLSHYVRTVFEKELKRDPAKEPNFPFDYDLDNRHCDKGLAGACN